MSLARPTSSAKSRLICSCRSSSNGADVYSTDKVTSNIFTTFLLIECANADLSEVLFDVSSRDTLNKLKITSTAKDADLRLGFIYFDADGDRLASLYANEAVTVGLHGDARFEFGMELHDILQNSFAKLFD